MTTIRKKIDYQFEYLYQYYYQHDQILMVMIIIDNDDDDWEGNRLWCMWFGPCVGGATMGAALQFCVSIPQICFRLKVSLRKR